MDELVDGIAHALRLRREPILPLATSSPRHRRRRGLGHVATDAADAAALYASRLRHTKITVPPVSFVQAASYVWIFLSLVVAALGFASCTSSSTSIELHCTPTSCTFERYIGSSGASSVPVEHITFPRERLVGAQSTRTRNGEAVNFESTRRRRQRVLGHSFLIKYKRRRDEGQEDYDNGHGGGLPNELVEESILFTKHNIGRKRARRQSAEINKYARGELDWLDVSEAKRWNALGILCLVVGLVSAAFALLLGDLLGGGEDEDDDKDK